MIYLDYQATTPVAPEVAKAMLPWIEERFANPHSPSRWGNEAEAAIEVARKRVEVAIGLMGGTAAFTGSATEALNWALKGTVEKAPKGRDRIITVATEHAAVLDTCEWLAGQGVDLTVLPVAADGRLDVELLDRELDKRVLLVAVMQVNNEIGVTQRISEIAELAHNPGRSCCAMPCKRSDASNSARVPIWSQSRRTRFTGQKGSVRCGCEKVRSPRPSFMVVGRRGACGPEPCRQRSASGLVRRRNSPRNGRTRDFDHVEKLWKAAVQALGDGWKINGSVAHRYHGNLNIRREGLDGARLIADLRDIAFSLGSACASGSGVPVTSSERSDSTTASRARRSVSALGATRRRGSWSTPATASRRMRKLRRNSTRDPSAFLEA